MVKKFSNMFPFEKEHVVYTAYARVALLLGLISLGLKRNDQVLIPSLVCNAALAPFHYLGIRPVYYNSIENLFPDWLDVEDKFNSNIKALLIVNYFGFPNDLLAAKLFCEKRKIFLIEDNAHGFLSCINDKPLGSFGDISVTSFHKKIAVPNGAALIVNHSCKSVLNKNILLRSSEIKALKFFVKKGIGALKSVKESALMTAVNPTLADQQEEFNIERYFLKMSLMSSSLMGFLDLEKHVNVIRQKYNEVEKMFWSLKIKDSMPLFKELKEGVCPYVFPIYTDNYRDVMKALYDKNATKFFIWPYFPQGIIHNSFSNKIVAVSLR